MQQTILTIFAIYGTAFLIKEANILSKPRNWLMRRSVLFYQMLECYACTSFHAGYIVYLITTPIEQLSFRVLALWALSGISIGLIGNGIVNQLYKEKS